MIHLSSILTSILLRLQAARDDQRGQTAAEYVGVLALIIVIATALLAVAGEPIATAVAQGVAAGIKKVTTTVTGG